MNMGGTEMGILEEIKCSKKLRITRITQQGSLTARVNEGAEYIQ